MSKFVAYCQYLQHLRPLFVCLAQRTAAKFVNLESVPHYCGEIDRQLSEISHQRRAPESGR